MPEIIRVQNAAEVDIQLTAAITSAGELQIRYAGQPQDSFTINCLSTLSTRIHVADFDDLEGTRWVVSAYPGTRNSGAPWRTTTGGVVDEGLNPDTVGTNGTIMSVSVYANPSAGNAAPKKKVISIEIKPEVPQPKNPTFG
jgi:hypothetical protein